MRASTVEWSNVVGASVGSVTYASSANLASKSRTRFRDFIRATAMLFVVCLGGMIHNLPVQRHDRSHIGVTHLRRTQILQKDLSSRGIELGSMGLYVWAYFRRRTMLW